MIVQHCSAAMLCIAAAGPRQRRCNSGGYHGLPSDAALLSTFGIRSQLRMDNRGTDAPAVVVQFTVTLTLALQIMTPRQNMIRRPSSCRIAASLVSRQTRPPEPRRFLQSIEYLA